MHLATLFATHLIQMTLVAGFVLLLTRTVTRRHAHLSYVLWLVVLVKCVTPPIWSSPVSALSWCHPRPFSEFLPAHDPSIPDVLPYGADSSATQNDASTEDLAIDTQHAPEALASTIQSNLTSDTRDTTSGTPSHAGTPTKEPTEHAEFAPVHESPFPRFWLWLAMGWLSVSLLVFFGTCYRATALVRRLSAAEVENTDLTELTNDLSKKVGLRGAPRLLVTAQGIGPAVIGLLRPVVVIPKLIADSCSRAELEPILTHELIHIRRGDLWASLLRHGALSLWWFHPLLWKISDEVRRGAERCCDEEVVACLGVSPRQYARTLVHVLELKKNLSPVPLVPGVRAVEITAHRMERIMNLRHGSRQRTPRWCWTAAILMAIVCLPGAGIIHGDEDAAADSPRSTRDADQASQVNGPVAVRLQCQFLSVSSAEIDSLPVNWQAMVPSSEPPRPGRDRLPAGRAGPTWGAGQFAVKKKLPTYYALLNESDAESVMAELDQVASKTRVLGRPTISTRDGVLASCQCFTSRPFVAGVQAGKPVVEQMDVGVQAFLRPVILKNKLQLEYQLESTHVRSVERIPVDQDSGTVIHIEVPVIAHSRVAGQNVIPEGKSLLIRMRAGESDARARMLLAFIKPTEATLAQPDTLGKDINDQPSADQERRSIEPRKAERLDATASLEERFQKPRRQLSLADCIRLSLSNPHMQRTLAIQVAMPSERAMEMSNTRETNNIEAERPLTVLRQREDSDLPLYDLKISVREFLMELTRAYWELLFHYRQLEATQRAYDNANTLVKASDEFSASEEAQARAQHFTYKARLKQAKSNLLNQESRLRYLMGLDSADGRLLFPTDSPTKARLSHDWNETKAESLKRRPEIRRARWRENQIEVELMHAKKRLLPKLDAVALYRFLGRGDEFRESETKSSDDLGTNEPGDVQEWQLGHQFQLPIGLRAELTAIQNLQRRQQQQQEKLKHLELEITHQLATAVRRLSDSYKMAQLGYNSVRAYRDQVRSAEAAFESSRSVPIDMLLDAQSRLAQHETDFFRALTEYQLAIAEVHHRKGTLLELLRCRFASNEDFEGALEAFDQQLRSTTRANPE